MNEMTEQEFAENVKMLMFRGDVRLAGAQGRPIRREGELIFVTKDKRNALSQADSLFWAYGVPRQMQLM